MSLSSFGLKKKFFISFFIFGCYAQAFCSCSERGAPLVTVCRRLIAVASLVAEHGL